MKRIKDIISESAINEEDVLKRNPLRPMYSKYGATSTQDTVLVDDMDDDIDTLDGRINARGRAEPVRKAYVDDARVGNNRKQICDKYVPILNELSKKLEQEGFDKISANVERLISDLVYDVNPDAYDLDFSREMNQAGVRRPIHVGDPYLKIRDYHGHNPAHS